ncbi:MAG: hypothetical protein R2712_25390 [Vicinamibacterales bacterium]
MRTVTDTPGTVDTIATSALSLRPVPPTFIVTPMLSGPGVVASTFVSIAFTCSGDSLYQPPVMASTTTGSSPPRMSSTTMPPRSDFCTSTRCVV